MKKVAQPTMSEGDRRTIDRLTFVNDGLETAVNETGIFAVDRTQAHRPVMRHALKGEVNEPRVVRFISHRCGSGDIVQAGAYYGDFLPALSTAVAPGAIVWTFEPNPHSAELARRTISLNRLRNVRLFAHALSFETSELHLAVATEGRPLGGLSRIVEDNLKPSADDAKKHSLAVEGRRLDDVVPPEREVSIIQLDLEGYEPNALRGATRILRTHRPILVLEMQPRRAASVLNEIVPELGYIAVGRLGNNAILTSPEDDILVPPS